MFLYIESTKAGPVIRFQVLAYDKDSGIGKLKGELGTEFSRDISKPALEKYGYKVVKSESELKLAPKEQVKAAPPSPEEDENEEPAPPAKKKKKAPVEDDDDE